MAGEKNYFQWFRFQWYLLLLILISTRANYMYLTFEVEKFDSRKKKKKRVILFNSHENAALNINYQYNLIPIDIIHTPRIKLVL